MADSSDEDHPFVKFGTPLAEADESIKPSNLKSTVPIFEQVVTDEQGRRRFHGAFTGGFSAGYYNTVGTKEGWVPTSFKSSRSNKTGKQVFRAQDFMDEEDMGDFGIAPKTLSTKDDFTSSRKRTAIEEKQLKFQEDKLTLSLGTNLADSLVIPIRSNIGVKLLRSMGWKDGQGLGPHLVRRKKKKKKAPATQNPLKVYGCRLPGVTDSGSEDEYIPENFKFAPKDQMPVTMVLKDDHHGIGYSGLNPNAALHKKVEKSTAVKAKMKSGSKLSFFGQAFGVGAYEEEDDDIFAQDSMSNYDAIMGEEKNPDDTYGWTKPLAITAAAELEAIAFGNSSKVIFVPAKKQSKLYPKVYPPPNIPTNYDPFRRLKLKSEKQRIDKLNLSHSDATPLLAVSEATPTHLNSDDRRVMLGGGTVREEPKKVQSVFDFISWEDRQRIEAAKRKPPELGFRGNTEKVEQPPVEEKIDRNTPLCNPTSLKPFADNPEKLRRYEQFERAVRQRMRDPYSTIDSNLTEWERKHERDEFTRISRVYLHLTTNINSRFTKASAEEDDKIKEGLHVNEVESEKKMKVFGSLTHTSSEWHPDPLLCKRFNVPDPYPNSDLIGSLNTSGNKYLSKFELSFAESKPITPEASTVKKETDVKDQTGIISDTARPPMFGKARSFVGGRWDKQPDFVGPATKRPDEPEQPAEDPDVEDDVEKAVERPPMDLFKSIFASSDEESSLSSDDNDDDDKEDKTDSLDNKPETSITPPASTSSHRISAADVFMRPLTYKTEIQEQNFEESQKQTPSSPMSQKETPSSPMSQKETPGSPMSEKEIPSSPMDTIHVQNSPNQVQNGCDDDKDDELFGPAPPPPSRLITPFLSTSNDDEDNKHHKKHSKHKKHKKHDHKKKKKKKR